MKKFIIFLACAMMGTMAWGQKVTKRPVTITKEYNYVKYGTYLISNEPDKFYMYIFPKFRGGKPALKHQIAIYNKRARSISYKNLTLKDDQYLISLFDEGPYFFADYLNSDRKTGCTYGVAHISKKSPSLLDPVPVFSLKKAYMTGYSIVSSDSSMHATLLAVDFKKASSCFYVFVYDKDGKEVYHKSFTPAVSGKRMIFQGATLSNDGEVALLLTTFDVKDKMLRFETRTDYSQDNSLHISLIKEQDIIEYRIPHFSFGDIHSTDIIRLKNGKYFIGGYYGPDIYTPSSGYFSCIFDPDTEDIVDVHDYTLPDEQAAKDVNAKVARFKYFVYIHHIYELDNGQIVMLGEQCALCTKTVPGINNTTSTSYIFNASDILYQTFDQSGESSGSHMIRKLQEHMASYRPSMRTSDYCAFSFDIRELGLSFSSFQKGNDIYLLYNNNSSSPDDMCLIQDIFDKQKNTCVRLAKISPDSEVVREAVMNCEIRENYFRDLWLVDDNEIYFRTNAHKGYIIESFSLDK